MPRTRIEGLLASFPKLVSSNSQHTTVETPTIRYLYQPLEDHYLVCLTNLQSNILQDLSTLHLFARVVSDISNGKYRARVFELADAFDEVVSMGWRENVNLPKIKTCLEMDSHEEKLHEIIAKNKEKEVKEEGKRKAKILEQQRKEQLKKTKEGGILGFGAALASAASRASAMAYSGNPASASGGASSNYPDSANNVPDTTSTTTSGSGVKGKGMQLGKKNKGGNTLMLSSLGVEVEEVETTTTTTTKETPASMGGGVTSTTEEEEDQVEHEDVHVEIEEHMTAIINRDGGLDQLEVKGSLVLQISESEKGRVKLILQPANDGDTQFKLHPNMDKKAFNSQNVIVLKDPQRSFPISTPLAVVKWRTVGKDESALPLTINCWPTSSAGKGCDVNIEYELENDALVLEQVVISIPIPGNTRPKVPASDDNCWVFNGQRSALEWQIPLIDLDNKAGALEFSVANDDVDGFFPVEVQFKSSTTYSGLDVVRVVDLQLEEDLDFSKQVLLVADEYTVV